MSVVWEIFPENVRGILFSITLYINSSNVTTIYQAQLCQSKAPEGIFKQ